MTDESALKSPDSLELRGKPTVGPRLGNRALLVVAAVMMALFGVLIFNTQSRKAQMEAKPKQEASEASKALHPSTEVADVFTKGVPDKVALIMPAEAPAAPVGAGQGVAPAGTLAVPELGSGSGVPELSAEAQAQAVLQQEREQAEREARQAKTAVANWDAAEESAPSQASQLLPQGSAMPSAQDLAGALGAAGMSQTGQAPRDQESKRAFLDGAKGLPAPILQASRQPARSAYELKTGHVISAVMLQGINSDLPGDMVALVTENVYDSATGRYLLVPAGAKLFGRYDSEVAFGQQRALVVWTRLVYPDSSTLELGGMQGTDPAGYAGFRDKVNGHYGRLAGFALLTSIMSSAFQLSQPQDTASGERLTSSQIVAAEVGKELTSLGTEITRRNLNVQPTLEIRPGYRFAVIVNRDVAFSAPYGP